MAPELVNLVNAVIREAYARPEKVTVTDLRYLVAAQVEEENKLRPATEQLPVPSEAAIARRIAALDLSEQLRLKQGKRAVQRESTQSGQPGTTFSNVFERGVYDSPKQACSP